MRKKFSRWRLLPMFLYAVFGWLQDSFTGIEQGSAYNLSVGLLKGFEQVGVGRTPTIILNVLAKFSSARKHAC